MIAILTCLWLLATLDTAFAGYRSAAGRNALLDKRRYFRRAMMSGILYGQAASILIVLLAGILEKSASPDLRPDLFRAAARMLEVYLPYALIIATAFIVRLTPSIDLRCLSSVLVFGPFVLIRPAVAIAGLAWAITGTPRPEIAALTLVVGAFMLSSERILMFAIASIWAGKA